MNDNSVSVGFTIDSDELTEKTIKELWDKISVSLSVIPESEFNFQTNPFTVSLLQAHPDAIYKMATVDNPLSSDNLYDGYKFVGECTLNGKTFNVFCGKV